mmetsp:Transcript_15563/g.30555  ORF Transcript_15563/g.30555 Transcript_15563/m.30555 type:complete len:616 (-) Transcript_15563:407-2254(-)|eukprot:CAMPEP_0175137298 /NCGR_PEP_ID=MMETSP0087-20121206/9738_1 /TAXON_ID=136419 /ORGANISM="Unknown Unknown, Strain D1" /LENGTH=615 /DNA_ID=CAMNT_0016420119 /DNA_START=57 /DNA_END=1904 /DNA_ORIENTATION=+
MLDESMFEDIHEIAENSAYLKAVEEKDISLEMYEQLPPFEELGELESKLRAEGALTFDRIFSQPTGYYMIKCFLVADYAVDKAIFIKDVEAYKSMRFESARAKIAKLLYQRFVANENEHSLVFDKGSSVFQIIQSRPGVQPPAGVTDDKSKGVRGARPGSTEAVSDSMQRDVSSILQIGTANNPIGVYGSSVKRVKEKVNAGQAPKDLFDEVSRDVMNDLKLDVFPRFKNSDFYKKYIRSKWIDTQKVTVKDFQTFRILGRGGFGAVHACRKRNSGTIYAQKCINKRLVKVKSALDNVMEERNVLTMMKSNFVTNLKYALQDEENLYLIMDLMLGGDLKFHLINAGRFTEKRARFYAAEVLLGLEHVHKHSIIYRDMKLENVLLDHAGHCRISDLGLAVVTKVKIKGYAGTPGYTAPEMIKNKLYGPGADIFSFGVMLYRMLCGSKPFNGKIDRDLDKAVIETKPHFPFDIFSPQAIDLLRALLQKRPENRIGCGPRGIEEIKEHPFFECIDWGLLEAGYLEPPFIPNKFDVNAASSKDIGNFEHAKYRHVKLDDKFKEKIKTFEHTNRRALQDEMTAVLEKADENKNFEKFAAQPEIVPGVNVNSTDPRCCTIL